MNELVMTGDTALTSVPGDLFEWNITEALFRLPDRMAPTAWAGHIPFLFALFKLDRPRTFVELGVFNGASFMAACTASREYNTETLCYGIDTWEGDVHAGEYDGGEIYHNLTKSVAELYPAARLFRGIFDSQLHKFDDRSIDILHIDGLHTYEAVHHDFTTWLPKMSDRGIILFHDTCVREREFGVWRLWEQLSERYASIEFFHSFGLGVLFVGPEPSSVTKRLLELWQQNAPFREFFRCTCEYAGGMLPTRFQGRVNEAVLRDTTNHLNWERENSEELRQMHAGEVARASELASALLCTQSRVTELETFLDSQTKGATQALKEAASYRKQAAVYRMRDANGKSQIKPIFGGRLFLKAETSGKLEIQRKLILASGLFDEGFYKLNNPDVANANVNLLGHYLEHGYLEGRWPNPLFDTAWYASQYPELFDSVLNPLVHYVNNWKSRRYNPNRFFSVQWYLEKYADIESAGIEPLRHFLNFGAQEMRDSGPNFSTSTYNAEHHCLARGVNPLAEFLQKGI